MVLFILVGKIIDPFQAKAKYSNACFIRDLMRDKFFDGILPTAMGRDCLTFILVARS